MAKICSADDTDPEFEDDGEQNCSAESDDGRSDDAGSDGDQSNGDGEELEDGADDDGFTNSGWAEAMAKILAKKTPASKSSILVKNKQLDKVKEKEKQEQLERRRQVMESQILEILVHPVLKCSLSGLMSPLTLSMRCLSALWENSNLWFHLLSLMVDFKVLNCKIKVALINKTTLMLNHLSVVLNSHLLDLSR